MALNIGQFLLEDNTRAHVLRLEVAVTAKFSVFEQFMGLPAVGHNISIRETATRYLILFAFAFHNYYCFWCYFQAVDSSLFVRMLFVKLGERHGVLVAVMCFFSQAVPVDSVDFMLEVEVLGGCLFFELPRL